MSLPLTNVHEALAAAATEAKEQAADAIIGSKVTPHVKAKLEAICERHGTTVSAYLRQCAVALVADYDGVGFVDDSFEGESHVGETK
jgi:hypothetical protein